MIWSCLISGLDSLSLAALIARLEDELMVDPFTTSEPVDFPGALGDFLALYERAAKKFSALKSLQAIS
jgi:hypothetical protein